MMLDRPESYTHANNSAKLENNRILVVGDAMLDRYFFGTADRISPEAPVPVVKISSMEDRPGGAANVARNVSSLGGKCTLIGVVGDDEAGESLSAILREMGITAHLFIDKKVKTTLKLRVVSKNQQMIRLDIEKSPTPEWVSFRDDIFTDILKEHHLIILSDYSKGALAHCQNLIQKALESSKNVLVDPKGRDFSIYRGAHLITPNLREFRAIVGDWNNESELQSLAEKVRQEFELDAILVTRGEDGMTLFDGAEPMHTGSEAREVFDVSGAGDTVIATVALTLVEGKSLRESVLIANRAAGIVVGKLGTSSITREEIA